MTQEILTALRNIEDKIMREPSSVLKAVTMTGVTSYAPRIHINGVAYDRVDGPKEPTSFIWTDAMYAVFKDRHTMSGLLAIWAAMHGAAVYEPKLGAFGEIEGESVTIHSTSPKPLAEPGDDDEGWIEWNGGECPVAGSVVQVVLRSGKTYEDDAEVYRWNHGPNSRDIIAYRVVSP